MIKKEVLKILACPKCKGNVEYDNKKNKIVCNICRFIYSVENDIPNMVVEKAEKF